RGVGPEQLVGLYVERSIEMVVGLLGILKAGAAYVPLDARAPPKRLETLVREAAPRLVLTQAGLEERLRGTPARTIALDRDWREVIQARPASTESSSRVDQHNLAYIIYTSGSTGTPKGVMIEHA